MKKYLFNGVEYSDINALGEAYASDFGLAIADAFSNTKKLLKFIKHFDKEKAKQCARFFIDSKYQNNVITFIIFTICNDPRVIINGLLIDFPNFVKIISRERNNKALNAFIEDSGISKTYAKMDFDKFLASDSFLIEKHFKEDFTYQYFMNYFKIEYSESIQGMLSNIFIYDEEVFRRGIKVINSDKFQLLLAHKVGFRPVYEARMSNMPLFSILKLIKGEFTEEELSKFIDDSFYMWLMDNLDKYEGKGEGAQLIKSLILLKKEYSKKKNKTFDDKIDYASEVYDSYIRFISLIESGLIGVKKKFDKEQYLINIPYSTAKICPDYIKNHAVKLNNNDEENENIEVEEDNVALTTKEVKKDDFDLKKCNKQQKTINKLLRFAGWSIFLVLLSIIIIAGSVALFKFVPNTFKHNQIVDDYVLWALLGGVALVAIIMMVILRVRANKSTKYLTEYKMAHKSIEYQKNNSIAIEMEKKRDMVLNNDAKYKKIAFRCQRFYSSIAAMFAGLVYGASGLFAISLAITFKNVSYTAIGIGMAFALLYGIIRKRKGAFTAILMFLVAVGAAIAMAILM